MNAETSRPAHEYLTRLDHLLDRADSELRREVMDGIREHLADAAEHGDAAVQTEIARLGTPEDVAASALAGGVQRRAVTERVGIWAGFLSLAAAVGGFGLSAAIVAVTAHFDEDADWSVSPLVFLAALVGGGMLAVLGLILLWANRSWGRRAQWQMTGALCGAVGVLALSEPLAYSLEPGAGFLVAPVILLVIALLLVGMTRRVLLTLNS